MRLDDYKYKEWAPFNNKEEREEAKQYLMLWEKIMLRKYHEYEKVSGYFEENHTENYFGWISYLLSFKHKNT